MQRSGSLILGAFATVAFSLTGYVLLPTLGLDQGPIVRDDGSLYPVALSADAQAGREVYKDLGCIYCHTQQVRPDTFGVDLKRGWGRRGSLPIDYVGQQPPLLGTMRTGPDLANIGARQPSEAWHLLHLYDPQLTSEGSNMPPFGFLFDVVSGAMPDALPLPEDRVQAGKSVVPSTRAKHLVAYLLTLEQDPAITPVAP